MLANYKTAQGRLHLAGLFILIAGFMAAVWVYVASPDDAGRDASGYAIVGANTYASDLDSSAREMQQVERLGGTAAVLTLKFHRWLGSLWHGRRLAFTLMALAAACGFLCLHIASLMGEDPGD